MAGVTIPRPERQCGTCDRWALEGVKDKVLGLAPCLGYNYPAPTPWNTPFCVLFNTARNLGERRNWIKKFQAVQQATNEGESKDEQ